MITSLFFRNATFAFEFFFWVVDVASECIKMRFRDTISMHPQLAAITFDPLETFLLFLIFIERHSTVAADPLFFIPFLFVASFCQQSSSVGFTADYINHFLLWFVFIYNLFCQGNVYIQLVCLAKLH